MKKTKSAKASKNKSEADYLATRRLLIEQSNKSGKPTISTPRHNRLPEEITPWMGIDPNSARALAESFPAPNPDMVVARRIRKIAGWKNGEPLTVGIAIPTEVLYVTGMRRSDLVLISAWHDGVIRITRIPEGQ